MKVLIYGYYGFKNLGDELILSKIIEDVRSIDSESEITVCTGDIGYTIKIHGVNGIDRFSLEAVRDAVKKSDVVIVGGGGLIHEYYGIDISDIFKSFGYNVASYSIVPLIAKTFQKPIFYWSHGIGPIFTEDGLKFTKWFYSLADIITVRDPFSYTFLKELCPGIKNLYLDTDTVIKLDISRFVNPLDLRLPEGRVKIGLNLRPWFGIDTIVKLISDSLADIYSQNKQIIVIPIPFDLALDKDILKRVINNLPESSVFWYPFEELETPERVISIMNITDIFIGTRLHSIISSKLLNIPTLALSYDIKTDEFTKMLNIPSIRIENLSRESLHKGIKALLFKEKTTPEKIEINYETPRLFANFINGKVPFKEVNESHMTKKENNISYHEHFIKSLEMEISNLERRLEEERDNHGSIVKGLNAKIEELSKNYSFLEAQNLDLERRLKAILSSKTWRLGQLYGKIFGVESTVRRKIKGLFNKGDGLLVRTSDSNHLVKEQGKKSPIQVLIKELWETKTNKYDVICFPIIDWFFRFQRPQQILTQFATNGSRVFYINPEFLNESDGYFKFTKIRENIYDISILSDTPLSIYRDNISKGNMDRMMESLTALRREAGIIEAVCFVQLPFWQPLAKRVKDEFGWKIIYDCMDDHSGFSTNNVSMVSKEEQLAAECDLLITASNFLYEKMKKNNEKCILVPNAADFDHFKHLPPNDLLREIKKPIIGYYGAISDWFDNELVEFLAESRKNWSFVFIGHTFGSNISRLKKMNNVYFLGEKPYSDLPKYLYWFDVCIIPFKLNNLIKATNPVKFYEFISSGKKVVSVEMPELLPYSEYLYIARDKHDFLSKIEEALKEDDPNIIAKRVELAKSHTWEKRFEILNLGIKKLYPKASIIIVTYNNLNYTRLCIDSVFLKTQYPNLEIIIVDNASTDGTVEYLKSLGADNSNVKIILNKSNEGFAKANNQGILASTGEYVVLLNNDTIVTRGWLSKLLKHLEDNTVGMVGPVTNFCGNEAKIEVSYKTIEELEDFSEKYIRNHIDPESFDINVLAFFCVALRRQVLDDVGLLDEGFGIGMFEDDDYAHRVRLKGYRILCAEDVFIHHFGEASFTKLKESGEYKKMFEENKTLFESKWGIRWEPHSYRWQK